MTSAAEAVELFLTELEHPDFGERGWLNAARPLWLIEGSRDVLLAVLMSGRELSFPAVENFSYVISRDPDWFGDMDQDLAACTRDDALFSNTKFFLLTEWWGPVDEQPMTLVDAACAQVVRMLMVGRFDPRYASAFYNYCEGMRLDETAALLLAHDATRYTDAAEVLAQYPPRALLSFDDRLGHDHLLELHRRATTYRGELFRTRWLPAAITPQEYGRVGALPLALLMELYPALWLHGYHRYMDLVAHGLNTAAL